MNVRCISAISVSLAPPIIAFIISCIPPPDCLICWSSPGGNDLCSWATCDWDGIPPGPKGLPIVDAACCTFCMFCNLHMRNQRFQKKSSDMEDSETHQPFFPPTVFAILAIMRYWQSSSSTSLTVAPLPFAI